MQEAPLSSRPPDRFDQLIGPARAQTFAQVLTRSRRQLEGHTLWHLNSAAKGGGVAEILSSVLGYLLGAGIETRWLVIDGNDDFFEITKRIHHLLHGASGDGGPLGDHEREVYEQTLAGEAGTLPSLVRAGDPVILNDPQTLGLAPMLTKLGARVIWSCHIGADEPNELTEQAWEFLTDYLVHTEARVFSRREYASDGLDPAKVSVIPPCVDPFSLKNQPMPEPTILSVLASAGLLEGAREKDDAVVASDDGTEITVRAPSTVHQDQPLTPTIPIVTQVSRWDPLKDHEGLLFTFVEHIPLSVPAHLVLAGPMPDAVGDDPEDRETYDALIGVWQNLPAEQRARIHIMAIPMGDPAANATVVNALQRHSQVVVQKSLAEGFGLTVSEAMLKGRPVVGSRVGGIQDQISDGESGLLVDDPGDREAFGHAINRVLSDHDLAGRLGRAAVERVLDEYVPPCYLGRYLQLIDQVR